MQGNKDHGDSELTNTKQNSEKKLNWTLAINNSNIILLQEQLSLESKIKFLDYL